MASLPVELLKAVVDDLPSDDLRRLRETNKTLSKLATPTIFRSLRAKTTIDSVQKLHEALSTETVAKHVKEVVIVDVHAGPEANKESGEVEDDEESEEDQEGLREALQAAISLFHELPLLESVSLTFSPRYEEEDEADTRLLQNVVLEGLVAHPLKLKSLTLDSLVALHNEVFDREEFASLVGNLTELHISTISEQEQLGWYDEEPFIEFWETTIPTRFLQPPSATLTSLSIHTDLEIGYAPRLPLSDMTYPNLTALSFGHIIFAEESGVEDFILRHKATLEKLKLKRCFQIMPEEGEMRRWSDIYPRFVAELTHLKEAKLDFEREGAEDGPAVRYAMLDGGVGYNGISIEEEVREADDVAEAAFLESIAARQSADK